MNTITRKEIESLISKNNKCLAYKLMKSEFFTPIRMERSSTVISTVNDDENVFIRLFDSLEDYSKAEKEIEPIKIPFEISLYLLKDMIDGFIVCIDSQEFVLDSNFVKSNLVSYTAQELKDINDNASSEGKNVSDAIFLTMLLSDEDYANEASDGIINQTLDLSFDMATVELDGKWYHLLFTSKDHLVNAFGLFEDSYHYSQIIDLSLLIRNFQKENIEGVLIDYPDGFQYLSTEELLGLDVKEDVKLRESLNYVFEL